MGEKERKLPHDSSDANSLDLSVPKPQIGEDPESELSACRWCLSPLRSLARVCPTCRGHQKWIWNYFGQLLLFVSTCISVILVCFSAVNMYLTKDNLDKAKEALRIAESASKEASKAQSMSDDLSLLADVSIAAISAPHDIHALRKLWVLSHSTNDKVKVIAEKQLMLIMSQLRSDYQAVTSDYWGFKRKHDPQYYGFNNMEGWTRVEYIKNYPKVPNDRRVVYVIQFLSDEKEADEEKFAFCYSALQLESTPEVIYALCAFIDTKAKLGKDYLFMTNYYLAWLKKRNAR
jgi:hypothetical protein